MTTNEVEIRSAFLFSVKLTGANYKKVNSKMKKSEEKILTEKTLKGHDKTDYPQVAVLHYEH